MEMGMCQTNSILSNTTFLVCMLNAYFCSSLFILSDFLLFLFHDISMYSSFLSSVCSSSSLTYSLFFSVSYRKLSCLFSNLLCPLRENNFVVIVWHIPSVFYEGSYIKSAAVEFFFLYADS